MNPANGRATRDAIEAEAGTGCVRQVLQNWRP
jgi:hypothetical protein